MRIGIPVARFHPGNTGDYAQRAFTSLGHTAQVLTVSEFFDALRAGDFDYFLCVDSSEPIPMNDPAIRDCLLARVGYWFIDYRHNKDRPTRIPNDLENARCVHDRGGWIFQSQVEDFEDCRSQGMTRVSWLPLGADPDIWTPEPVIPKEFHIGFVGNIWDAQRKRALDLLMKTQGLRVGFLGQGNVWMEDAAALMRKCLIGFNISSFFGQSIAFDVNMRFFETLSCGVPLLTNDVPGLEKLLPGGAPFIRTYRDLGGMLQSLLSALKDPEFLESGQKARQWILNEATYAHRMKQVILQIEHCA